MSAITDRDKGDFILGIFSQLYVRQHRNFTANFTDQWYVTCTDCGAQFKAVDDPHGVDGISFQEVV